MKKDLYYLSRPLLLAGVVSLSLGLAACGGGGGGDPGTTNPGTTDPGTTDPGTTDPGTTDPTDENHAPVADAPAGQSVNEFEGVTLTGSGSDEDGDELSFSWTVPEGFTHKGTDAKTLEITNTPAVDKNSDYIVTLHVTDPDGATDSDELRLIVINNKPPKAIIRMEQGGVEVSEADENTIVHIFGSDSIDTDGDIVSYQWDQIDTGPLVIFSDTTTEDTEITLPLLDENTDVEIRLTISDDDGDVVSETATLTGEPVTSAVWFQDSATRKLVRFDDVDTTPVTTPSIEFLTACGANMTARLANGGNAYDTAEDTSLYAFDLSTNGEQAAFAADCDAVTTFSLYAINTDGTGLYAAAQMAGTNVVEKVAISPDGSRIAYIVNDNSGPFGQGRTELFVVTNDGDPAHVPLKISPDAPAGPDPLTLDAISMRWSPNSEYLAFVGDFNVDQEYELWVADFTGEAVETTAVLGTDDFENPGGGKIGPWIVNRQLAVSDSALHFVSDHEPDDQLRLYMADITDLESGFSVMPNFDTIRGGLGEETTPHSLALSNSQQKLAVHKNEVGVRNSIFVGNSDGSGTPVRLLETGNNIAARIPPTWSPNDELIVFGADYDLGGKNEPWIVRTDGSMEHWKAATIGDPADADSDLNKKAIHWSLDGSQIYMNARADLADGFGIFRCNIEPNSPLEKIFTVAFDFKVNKR